MISNNKVLSQSSILLPNFDLLSFKVTDVRINQKQGRDNAVARGGKAPAFVSTQYFYPQKACKM